MRLTISLPTDRKDNPGTFRLSKEYVYKSLSRKRITTIDLDVDKDFGDDKADYVFRQKLGFVQREIERLEFTNDTLTVLKIQLGENNTYGEFVWIFNRMLLYGVKRFIFTDDFYVFANPPEIHFTQFQEDYVPNNLIIKHPAGLSRWQLVKAELKEEWESAFFIIKHNWLYLLGFCLLIILPGILTIRSNSRTVTLSGLPLS